MRENHWQIKKTGEVGKLVPCPCNNPIILEFKDGSRDVFFLRQLTSTTQPITDRDPKYSHYRENRTGRPKGLARKTISLMHAILKFLETQPVPVSRLKIEKHVKGSVIRALMIQPSKKKVISLESLGLVKRLPYKRTWVLWKITEKGRVEGESIINNLSKKTKKRG